MELTPKTTTISPLMAVDGVDGVMLVIQLYPINERYFLR